MEWKAEYGILFFMVFVGAAYRLVNDDSVPKPTIAKRLFSQLAAVLLGGLILIGICLEWLGWPVIIPGILGIPVGTVAEKFLRLWMQYGNEATGFWDFVDRMQQAYKMVKNKGNDSMNNENTPKL